MHDAFLIAAPLNRLDADIAAMRDIMTKAGRARTRGLAEQAIMNFENSPRTKFANQLQTDGVGRTKANEKDIENQ